MKFKITQKETRQNFIVYKCGYCEIQALDFFIKPTAYNSGMNGWNYDLYVFGCYAISTGYNPIGRMTYNKFTTDINNIVSNYRKLFDEKKITYTDAQIDLQLEIRCYLAGYDNTADFYELESVTK